MIKQVTIAGRTQWDAPMTFVSEESYAANRDYNGAKDRISSLENKIKKAKWRLNHRNYAQYKDEILAEISEYEQEMEILKLKMSKALEIFRKEEGI